MNLKSRSSGLPERSEVWFWGRSAKITLAKSELQVKLNHRIQLNKQQLEQDLEQWTCSKLGKEYFKVVYRHSTCLNYIQSTSCEMAVWMKHKLKSRLPGKASITSDMQVTEH